MHDATVTLQGVEWTIKFVTRKTFHSFTKGKRDWGDCDWNKKIIRVRKDLSMKNIVDTLLHETRHGQHEVLFEAESFVDSTSTELAEVLMATGIIQ